MIAVIETSGRQYIVEEGKKIVLQRVKERNGDAVVFDKVLLISGTGAFEVGNPYLSKASVTGKIVRDTKKKITVWKFKSKVRYRKKKGYTNNYSEVLIESIKH